MEKDMEYKSLLETTQNTRDLGGYETCYGRKTKSFSVLRSDRQGYASDRDKKFLVNHDITTVIDMRTEEDVKKKPSSLTNVKGMTYYNFPVYEGSKVPFIFIHNFTYKICIDNIVCPIIFI